MKYLKYFENKETEPHFDNKLKELLYDMSGYVRIDDECDDYEGDDLEDFECDDNGIPYLSWDESSMWQVTDEILDLMSNFGEFDRKDAKREISHILMNIRIEQTGYVNKESSIEAVEEIYTYFNERIPDILDKFNMYEETMKYNL